MHDTTGITAEEATASMIRIGPGSESSSSSPILDSPTPACGMASATARLQLGDDDSPNKACSRAE